MTTLKVWSRAAFEFVLEVEGLKIEPAELKAVTEIFGVTVVADPALPPGRCEFRNPETGELLLAFDLQ